MKIFTFYLLLLSFPLVISAQSNQTLVNSTVNNSSRNSANLDLVDTKILDVYGQQFMDNNPDLFPVFRKFLMERIEYKVEAPTANEKYPKLSEFGLRNKNNPSLTLDYFFDEVTFNLLKYNVSAFEPLTQIIRFDNTDILIIVKSQN